jgi:hypothetical protein
MSNFLDYNGLLYLWQRIKSKFLRGNAGGVFYGTSSTAAGTAAKVVDCEDFTSADLVAGTVIAVKFTATNSGAVASLSLNVNGTGAKNIKYINNGTLGNLSSAGYLKANTTYYFYYDGTYWVALFNYNTTYSAMSEAEALAGTATTARTITAARLKQAIEEHAPVSSVNGQTGAVTVAVPTKTSDLTNDSNFVTESQLSLYAKSYYVKSPSDGSKATITINVRENDSWIYLSYDKVALISCNSNATSHEVRQIYGGVPTVTRDESNKTLTITNDKAWQPIRLFQLGEKSYVD